jgi:acyl-CoA reductase-like NAD-dependent aldehyde dehydrogenase
MASGADEIRSIVEQVLRSPDVAALLRGAGTSPTEPGQGVFSDVDAAVKAAAGARLELAALPLDGRRRLIDALRHAVIAANESLSREAVEETGLGNVPDKVAKNALAALKTPGVEDVEPTAWSDEHGLTLMERAPWGVIASITPVTNPIATIASNAIGMLAAGNAVVFNVHPGAKRVSCRLVALLNGAIAAAGGPRNLLTAVAEPTIESAGELMHHPGIALLVVTGGPGVVTAAMASGKKAICAGPGNPPCVVDETADLAKAGRSIVEGAGFDHNVVCICEKEVLAVDTIADRLKAQMAVHGAVELSGRQAEAVARVAIVEPGGPGRHGVPNKDLVGRSAHLIARTAGVEVPADARILLLEVGREHPLVWTEQLMPVLPLVRMPSADAAIEFAVQVEHGYRHTAMIHSHDIERLSRMAKLMDCSIFVKNGPCTAGLGSGGAGYASFTVASPTGEGVTRARTFTRERRCTLVDAFRII